MKKRIFVSIIACLILIVGIGGFIIWNNNRIVSTVTLDINPSIEINLTKNEKIKSVIALNEDAKELINDNLKGKNLDDTLKQITDNIIAKGYANEDELLEIVLYSEGNISNKELEIKLKEMLEKKQISSNIITIDEISKEDEELAKKYNVSPAKISYIKTIIQNNKNLDLEDLANKSVSELEETKETGKYCDEGYTLEGDWCLREKERVSATSGEVCPRGYAEHEGKCYEETKAIESKSLICNVGFKLVDNKCVMNEVTDAFGKCDSGDYDNGFCIRKELIGNAEEYCRLTPATDILINHKCYGPKPTINGGCLNGDRLINGGCVDMSSYYESDWICRIDGKIMYLDKNGDHKCYKEVKTKPTSYYCEENAKLEGTKCIINRTEEPLKEMSCPNGTIPINDGSRCLNLSKIAPKESGLVCEGEKSRLKGNQCIIYEMIEAKNNS